MAQTNDWDMALGDQEMQAAQGALTELQNMDDSARKERETIMNRRRNHLAAAMDIADRNGGFVPPSILGALSNEFGFPVAGGNFAANGSFIVYENRAGENGTQQIVPKAIIGPMQGYKLLEKTGLGSRIRESMYGKFKKFRTAEQLSRIGINPPVQAAPQAPDGTTMTGDTAGRLARRIMPERRGVSVFGTDGKGNWSSRTIDPATGEERGETAGSRSQEYQGKWKVLESGPDGMRYENDKTGEVVRVPKGSTLNQVLQGGASEKERIAAAELAGKERIAQIQYGTPMQRQVAELREEERLLQQSLYNKDGTPVEMSDEARAQIEGQMRAIRQARLAMMGFGVQTPGANAEAPRAPSPIISKEQAARAIAAREELAKRKAAEQQSAQPAETQVAQPQTVAEKPMEQPRQTEKPAEAPAKLASTSAKPSKSSRRQSWVQKPDKELRQEIDEAHRIINENSAIILDRMNGSSSDDEEWIVEGINALKKRADQGELSDSDISYLRSIMKVVDRRKNSWRSRPSKQDERPAGKPNMAPQMM